MTEFQLRDVFNKSIVEYIANNIQNVYPEFETTSFIKTVMKTLLNLSFLDRCVLITSTLEKHLPTDYEQALNIIVKSLGPLPDSDELTGYDSLYIMPLSTFVSRNGLDSVDLSLQALYEMTIRSSSEFDVRPFITKYPEKTLKFLKKLTNDNLALGRRLSSEGTRPRLPLSSPLREFIKDPSPVIEILELLKDDPSLIVRRSVANNLNDISKDNPDIVVSLLEQWSKKASKERKWLIGHALRTLLKQGHQGALAILGYFPPDEIELTKFSVNKDEITLGDEIKFEIEINNKSGNELKLMIDYLIYFMKANGKQSPKVFKLSKRIISPYEKFSLNKKHQIKPLSTRKIYQGRHCLQIQINGKKFEKLDFNVRF